MGIESIVNVVVSATAARVTQQGFGTPLLLSTTPRPGADLVRYYTTPAAVEADYPVTSPEYRVASRMFTQRLRPARLAIGKRSNLPTQSFTFTAAVEPETRYAFEVDGAVVEFTSDDTPTEAEIYAGLVAAYGALPTAPPAALTNVGPGEAVALTASAAGTWLDVTVLTPDVLSVTQDQADAGVVADLNAIRAAQPDWYGVLTLFPSQAEVLAIAEWVEANRRLFFVASSDSAMRAAAYDPASPDLTLGGALRSRNYGRTAVFYQADTSDFVDAASMAYFLATAPGSATMHLKQLVGIVAPSMEPNEETNLKSYNVNVLSLIGGLTVVQDGKVAAGEFIDIVRDTDWHVARTQERVFQRMAAVSKVPYTDAGVSILTAEVAGQAQVAEDAGFLKPGWTVTSVPVADVPLAERQVRRYPNIVLTAEFQGAIHIVDPLVMTLTV